jgi:hypothetical protein
LRNYLSSLLQCLIIAATFVLPACVSRTVVIAPPPHPPATINNQPFIPAHVSTASGVKLRLGLLSSVNPDCSLAGMYTVIEKIPPMNGVFTQELGKGFTNFPKENQRYACNLQQTPGILMYYTANPGYKGQDTLTVELLSPEGRDQTVMYSIDVK